MAHGRTNRGIGETLFLSESSVEKHVKSIFGKLGLAQETQLHRRVVAVLTFLRDFEDAARPGTVRAKRTTSA